MNRLRCCGVLVRKIHNNNGWTNDSDANDDDDDDAVVAVATVTVV